MAWRFRTRRLPHIVVFFGIICSLVYFMVFLKSVYTHKPISGKPAGEKERKTGEDLVMRKERKTGEELADEKARKTDKAWGGFEDLAVRYIDEEEDPTLMLDISAAKELRRKMRIMCWIPTTKENLREKVPAVNQTWVQRCDAHIYFVSMPVDGLYSDVVLLDTKEGHEYLTEKSEAALTHLYKHYGKDHDWFLKGDDDAYFIIENLRFLLSHYDPSVPVYLGHLYKQFHDEGYMSGGAGYVLSRAALSKIKEGLQMGMCAGISQYEDVAVGICLHRMGVHSYATRDKFGRDAFHPLAPNTHIVGPIPDNQIPQDRFLMVSGHGCCSQLTISFHWMEPDLIRVFDHLLYRISVYGRQLDMTGIKRFFRPAVVPPLDQ